jgi:PAS domain S-box-containing protein
MLPQPPPGWAILQARAQRAPVRELPLIFDEMRSLLESHENHERLEILFQKIPLAVAMFDRDMRYLMANDRWLSDYGLEGRSLRGRSHYEIFPEIPERWKETHRRGLAGEVLREQQDYFERADGSVQWLWWEMQPWTEYTGEIGGIVIFTQDITELKRTEERDGGPREHR